MQDGFAWTATAVQYDDDRYVALEHHTTGSDGETEVSFAVDLPAGAANGLATALRLDSPAIVAGVGGSITLARTPTGFLLVAGDEHAALFQQHGETLAGVLEAVAREVAKTPTT